MSPSLSDFTTLIQLIDQARASKACDEGMTTALNAIAAYLAELVAMKEQAAAAEAADKAKDEAHDAAELAAVQALPEAINRMTAAVVQALATRPEPSAAPTAPAPAWTKLQVNVNTDRMGRMESFTVEKVA